MKKTLLYVIVFAVLGYAAWYFLFNEEGSGAKSEMDFTIKDTSMIGKIMIARNNGDIIKLENLGSEWRLNDQWKARPASVSQMLTTMYKQKAMKPAPKASQNEIVKSMAGNAIKVEVYDKKGKTMRKFYIGPEIGGSDGSYMIMDGSNTVYEVQIPNHNGYLSAFYEPVVLEWRDRTVFNVAPDNLEQVELNYADNPDNSFTWKDNNGQPTVITHNPIFMEKEQMNKRRVNIYKQFFQSIYSEAIANGEYALDSMIVYGKKRVNVKVTPKKGEPSEIDVYWILLDRRSKNTLTPIDGVPIGYDADRFLAVMNNGADTAYIQSNTFEKIFRKAYEFYQPETDVNLQIQTPKN